MALGLGLGLELGCDRAGSLGARRRQPCLCLCQRLAGLGLDLCLCQLLPRIYFHLVRLRLGLLETGLVFAGMLCIFTCFSLVSLYHHHHHHHHHQTPLMPASGLFSSCQFPPNCWDYVHVAYCTMMPAPCSPIPRSHAHPSSSLSPIFFGVALLSHHSNLTPSRPAAAAAQGGPKVAQNKYLALDKRQKA
ncbi:hypothetical protein GGI42DRAFT_100181 [Trichoderma sp. SZMC 28013]